MNNKLRNIKIFFQNNYFLLLVIFFILFLLLFTDTKIYNENASSKFLTMESIVERGTFVINEKSVITCDKILRDDNFYSSKPPVLTLIGSGIYYLLHNLLGQNFPYNPYYFTKNSSVYAITILTTGATFILLLFYFHKALKLFDIKRKYKILLLTGLFFGTLYLTYAKTFNNHTIAGSFLFISFYYLLIIKLKKTDKNLIKNISLSGFFVSLAAVIDLPTGLIFFGLFFIYYALTMAQKKYLIFYIMPAIPLFFVHLFFNYQITGDFLPAQFHPEYWIWKDAKCDYTNLASNTKHPILLYAFNILFGARGLLFYSPILVFSFYSIYKIIKAKKHNFQLEAIIVLIGFIIISLFYIIKIRGYAGSAYGFRWLIAVTPLIYFFTIFCFTEKFSKKFINWFKKILVISIIMSVIGLYNPWAPRAIIFKINNKEITSHSTFLSNVYSMLNKLNIKP